MRAPSRASETVSVPMWHCRCTAVEARDVAEPRQVEADDLAQERRVLGEAGDGVVRRGGVGRDAFVPARAVDVAVVVHAQERRTPACDRAAAPAEPGAAAARRAASVTSQLHRDHDVGVVRAADLGHRGAAGRAGVAAGAAATTGRAARRRVEQQQLVAAHGASGRRRSARALAVLKTQIVWLVAHHFLEWLCVRALVGELDDLELVAGLRLLRRVRRDGAVRARVDEGRDHRVAVQRRSSCRRARAPGCAMPPAAPGPVAATSAHTADRDERGSRRAAPRCDVRSRVLMVSSSSARRAVALAPMTLRRTARSTS